MWHGLPTETFFLVVRQVKMPLESENCDPPAERIGELHTGVRAGTRQQKGDYHARICSSVCGTGK